MTNVAQNQKKSDKSIKNDAEFMKKIRKNKKNTVNHLEHVKTCLRFCAHDLREPLRIISSFLHLLFKKRNSSWDLDEKKYVEIILQNLTSLNLFTQDILLQADRGYQPSHTVLSLEQVIKDVQDFFSLMGQIEPITFIVSEKIPKVFGNVIHLQHVFMNLVDNIIKHSPFRPICIHIHHTVLHPMVYISVSDRKKSSQGDSTEINFIKNEKKDEENEQYKTILSHGIGLTLCQTLIHQHGGQLTLQKEETLNLFDVVFSLPIAKDNH